MSIEDDAGLELGLWPPTAIIAYERLTAELERARAELEIERLRLAGCGVAALGYFDECADELKSASLSDVLKLRERAESAEAKNASLVAQITESENQRAEGILRNAELKNKNDSLVAQMAKLVEKLKIAVSQIEFLRREGQARHLSYEEYESVLAVQTEIENTIAGLPASVGNLMRLVSEVDNLLAWNKKYPKNLEYQYGEALIIERELDAIVDKLRDLRGEK